MSNIDSQVINKFLESDEQSPVVDRQTLNITDSNSNSYTNNIIFNCQALGSCSVDQWYSFNEAYIQIPYIVSMKYSTDILAINPSLDVKSFITLKDGYYHIIDTINVEQNGVSVQQIQNFNNVHTHFKKLSISDVNYINKNFATLGVTTDTVETLDFEAGLSSSFAPASTYYNNTYYVEGTTVRETNSNKTRNDKLISIGNINALPSSSLNAVRDAGNSYYIRSGTGVNMTHYWVFMAVIRLADISGYFEQMPLSKSNDIRLNITYNSTKLDLGYGVTTAGGTIGGDIDPGNVRVSQITGNTCPYIISTPVITNDATATVLSIRSNVSYTEHGSAGQPITQCQLYVPLYTINSSTSQKMISMKPTTNIKYTDIYTYTIINRTAANSVVETITTGIKNPKYLFCIPYPHTTPVSQFVNPFNTSPATSSNIILRDFQVNVGGKNIFRENVKYDYFEFMECVSKIFGYDGNNNPQISSGVINQYMYMNGYRIYMADLSRVDREVSQSIVLSFTNTGAVPITCLVFLAYERNINIKTSTGEIS